MVTSDWSDFLAVDWLTMEHISILLPPDYILRKQILLTLREAHEFTQCVTRSLVTHTSFDMSRKSISKDQTKALNIPFTLTQGDLLQEALAVTFFRLSIN
jgi:hypothetical protein